MKRLFIPLAALALLAACNNAPKGDAAETTEKQEAAAAVGTDFTIDSNSVINWKATKATGAHEGTLKIQDGSFAEKDGAVTGGSFTISIASLTNTDMAADTANKNKLEGHLKSPDFFDVAKYPTAKFEITSVEPFKADTTSKEVVLKDATHTIKGNLTLKDSTKNISFPAKIVIAGNKLTAVANFNIDRTLWGMNYKGPNNPQDWFIRKEVNLQLDLSATKK